MGAISATERPPARTGPLSERLDRRFEAAVFDWDGTAVPDRRTSAFRLRLLVEKLSRAGFHIVVVSGTNLANVDGQLRARPTGPGRLLLCLSRGSEVFSIGPAGPELIFRRTATAAEDAALTAAAELVRDRLAEHGLRVAIVAARLNRRKLDLIPEPEWTDPPKARIAELVAAVEQRLHGVGIESLARVVGLAREAAAEAGLADPRVTSDAKHVEIGLTDKSDSARWAFCELWRHGVSPGLVLLGGDEFGALGGVSGSDSFMLVPEAVGATAVSVGVEPAGVPSGVVTLGGGHERFLDLLADQLARRERREVPDVNADPAWSLAVEGLDPELERVHESLLTLADGRIGTRGTPLLAHPAETPAVLAAGVYRGEGPEEELLHAPLWNRIGSGVPRHAGVSRILDLRSGLLRQELGLRRGRPVQGVQFSSLARPGTAVLRAEGPPAPLRPGSVLETPPDVPTEGGEFGDHGWLAVGGEAGVIAAAGETRDRRDLTRGQLDRVAAYSAGGRTELDSVLRRLVEAEEAGFERLLCEHRRAWARRWEEADIAIDGDPELQRAVRFALFHLMASAADRGEAPVGARGLSGPAYRGHVFWDGDVYVLPFLAATHPKAARAMLEYRVRRLEVARAAAARLGLAGARFPWESASTGVDVTPTHAHLPTGEVVLIRNGEHEEHVVAAVAWGAACYLDWTADEEFARSAGRTLFVETARYWASRIRFDGDGRGHIHGVIGPDEYHGPVDDNAYTNVMARWNLRRAAAAVQATPGGDVPAAEVEEWLRAAEVLVDGYNPQAGLYEQFAGFFRLEPLVIEDLTARPVAADVLLGRERVAGAQVIKQADVLMLHHLVPGEVVSGSLGPNVDFYEPRTAHGSSLSPGIHAALLARLGRLDEALALLKLSARIDLDDLTGTTAGGLHLAAMGSVWQALAFGFAGLRPQGRELALDPRLPPEWRALELRVRFRGRAVRIRMEPGALTVWGDPEVPLHLSGAAPVSATPAGVRLEQRHDSWEVV
ncbi:MAG TPA: glycosyl hydrolase family 65 protein [Gaiellaceae bacterium]|nr:glycosyl hydrolase family 65 protein [Gaiellaceae bacterium]